MENQGKNNIKLGAFVLAGFLVLVLFLSKVGKQHHLFGDEFELKTRVSRVNGLIEGSNVRFSGIQAGTVTSIKIVNDTTFEIVFNVDDKVTPFILKNAVTSIGTDGLMGNKILNITPVSGISQPVSDGNMLAADKLTSMDQMISTLSKTNVNVALISEIVKRDLLKLDSSNLLKILNSGALTDNINSSIIYLRSATDNARKLTAAMNEMVSQTRQGRGTLGMLLTDTVFEGKLKQSLFKIESAGDQVNQTSIRLNTMIGNLDRDLNDGRGSMSILLKDSLLARNITETISNIRKGTYDFDQNMEALKHNFLFRGYFKNQEKQQAKQQKKAQENLKKPAGE
jgi:phospholipid/cholesterol/gamma-HCH transport system substrate-binding protein